VWLQRHPELSPYGASATKLPLPGTSQARTRLLSTPAQPDVIVLRHSIPAPHDTSRLRLAACGARPTSTLQPSGAGPTRFHGPWCHPDRSHVPRRHPDPIPCPATAAPHPVVPPRPISRPATPPRPNPCPATAASHPVVPARPGLTPRGANPTQSHAPRRQPHTPWCQPDPTSRPAAPARPDLTSPGATPTRPHAPWCQPDSIRALGAPARPDAGSYGANRTGTDAHCTNSTRVPPVSGARSTADPHACYVVT
jgi:hypothetical protein